MSSHRSPAAVLILVKGKGDAAEVLLIQRSANVRTHQSQVAFPGGGAEPQDENDPKRTALRECFEEVGVPPRHVKIIKSLAPLPTVTGGFFVVPVLGELSSEAYDLELALDKNEVEHAEWVSIKELMNSKNEEGIIPIFEWVGKDNKNRKVWGLTAIIFELIFNPDTL